MKTKTKSNPNETYESIKLGIDAHAKRYCVGRQVDGAQPLTDRNLLFQGILIGASVLPGLRGCKLFHRRSMVGI